MIKQTKTGWSQQWPYHHFQNYRNTTGIIIHCKYDGFLAAVEINDSYTVFSTSTVCLSAVSPVLWVHVYRMVVENDVKAYLFWRWVNEGSRSTECVRSRVILMIWQLTPPLPFQHIPYYIENNQINIWYTCSIPTLVK